MYLNREQLDNIRKQAASQAINRTIRLIGEELNVTFPQNGTPTENRATMIEILRLRLELANLH